MTRPALALAVCVLALVLPSAALAEGGGPGFGLSVPGEREFFQYTAQPGDIIRDSIIVMTASPEPLAIELLAVPAAATLNGGWNSPTTGEGGASDWLALDAETVVVSAGLPVEVGFFINVPDDAGAGVHDAGIVAVLPSVESSGGVSIRLVQGVGVAVSILVPGPETCGLRIRGMTAQADVGGVWTIEVDAVNAGNFPWSGTAGLMLDNGLLDVVQPIAYTCAGCDLLISNRLADGVARPGTYTGTVVLSSDAHPCTAVWSGPVVIAGADVAAADEAARGIWTSAVVAWLVAHGTALLIVGLLSLAMALALLVALIIKRARRAGRW